MTQEQRAQFQLPFVIDSELLQARQNILRNLDPFQEGPDGERLRAIGLSNLYLQMVDPSVEFLEATASSLISMPFSHIRQLQFATYEAGDNPNGFFTKRGVVVEDSERLQAGIGNSFKLIEGIARRFDYETGELNWGEELNPKALAESAHERIQISKGERQIRKAVEQVQNEPKLRRRYHMGLSLKRQVLDYIGSFQFTLYRHYDRDKLIDPTWENLTQYSGLSTQLETKDGGSTVGSFGLEEAVDVAQAAILRHPFEKRLARLPIKNQDRFDQLRFQYGAKAANLIILSELVGDINRLRKNSLFGVKIAVPDFQSVPVDSYRAWREGKLIDDQLRPYFDWASALESDDRWYSDDPAPADYMVRSSAVFSEDGETVTGAGIYQSVRVYGRDTTFEGFKDAVVRVYESTDSPQAQVYRSQHGIDGEEMGLVIQKYVSPHSYSLHGQSEEGYINSRLTGVPKLMEVVTRTSRNFIRRDELDFFFAMDADRNEGAFRAVHHFPPDQYKVDPDLPIRVAQLTAVVEKIWGRDIQVEFVAEGSTINFVQVRELPAVAVSQAPEIQFPDETPIHSGASIGFGDMELPVLDAQDDNSERNGVVVFVGNYGFSWGINTSASGLPQKGAVIVYGSDGSNGHIQTLCAEKGLICIFPDRNEDNRFTPGYRQLSELRRVRIVSNGIEGRVYGEQAV